MFEYLKSDLDKYTSFAQWKVIVGRKASLCGIDILVSLAENLS